MESHGYAVLRLNLVTFAWTFWRKMDFATKHHFSALEHHVVEHRTDSNKVFIYRADTAQLVREFSTNRWPIFKDDRVLIIIRWGLYEWKEDTPSDLKLMIWGCDNIKVFENRDGVLTCVQNDFLRKYVGANILLEYKLHGGQAIPFGDGFLLWKHSGDLFLVH
jgi:hypothetical protein